MNNLKTTIEATEDLSKALEKLKKELWKERWYIFHGMFPIWTFGLGIGIGHYYPNLTMWLF